jgi:glycosyltransferase involved in cell wall biosynthesis
MARRLVSMGHEVNLVTSNRDIIDKRNTDWYQTNESGIIVHWLPVAYSNYFGFYQRMQAFMRFAYKAACKATFLEGDIIFATSTPLTIALPAIFAARRKKVPMVFEVRDLWPALPIAVGALKSKSLIMMANWLEMLAYRHASRIVALSPGMRDGIINTGYPADRVHVIPNGSDLDLFCVDSTIGNAFRQKYDWLQDRPLVVYTGALGRINDVSYLVKLAAVVKSEDPNIRFLVVGDGQEKKIILNLAQEMGVLNVNFFIMDRVPKEGVPAILSAADIATSLVLDIKAIWDNSANKFFDALASGKPIAINYGGWQADIIQDNNVGVVLDAHDMHLAKNTLLGTLRDETWLKQAGRNARQVALDRFERGKLAQELEQVLIKTLY